MKKTLSVLLAVLVIAGLALTACAPQQAATKKAEEKAAPAPAPKVKLVFASDATWPPMEFVNDKKEIVGFDIDLVNEIAKAGGFEAEVRNTAWDGIFAGLENETYNAIISSVTITDERKVKMDFSDAYFKVDQAIVVPAAVKNVAKLADLKGKTIGAQIGTTGAMEVQKDKTLKLKSYDEVGLAFEDLINGRLAAVVCDTPTAAQYALQNDKYKGKLIVAGQIATDEFYGIAVKKGKADALKLINEGLKKAKESGRLDELKKKWIP